MPTVSTLPALLRAAKGHAMIPAEEREAARKQTAAMIRAAGFPLSDAEAARIEVTDFGLGNHPHEGAQILVLAETQRTTFKVLTLLPRQTLPEHLHPPVGDDPGKEEVVRVLWGRVAVVLQGQESLRHAQVPPGKDAVYTCRREQILGPGGQILFAPGEKHWFQTTDQGAVILNFSSVARDALDIFTDPAVVRFEKAQE